MPTPYVKSVLQATRLASMLGEIGAEPVAAATVAQVHRALRNDDHRVVALKIMRPDVARLLALDCRIAAWLAGLLAVLPPARAMPLVEAVEAVSKVLLGQLDFAREAVSLERLRAIFKDCPDIRVPVPHLELCRSNVVTMDFLHELKRLDDPSIPSAIVKSALLAGVRALFRMIFEAGFLHCDLHPGNMMVDHEGRLVILDAGFVAELDDSDRRLFAEFFMCIAFGDGRRAASIVRSTAEKVPRDLDVEAFDVEIGRLIQRVRGLKARDFQVGKFVLELFAIQRRHHIRGTPQFTLPIASLLVFEGIAKQRFPELDFQAEAVPFVVRALEARVVS